MELGQFAKQFPYGGVFGGIENREEFSTPALAFRRRRDYERTDDDAIPQSYP